MNEIEKPSENPCLSPSQRKITLIQAELESFRSERDGGTDHTKTSNKNFQLYDSKIPTPAEEFIFDPKNWFVALSMLIIISSHPNPLRSLVMSFIMD